MFRSLCLFLSVLLLSAISAAQQARCDQIAVTFNLFLQDGRLGNGLKQEGVRAEAKSHRVDVRSLTPDMGPRRILLVLDDSKLIDAEARKATAQSLKALIEGSRPEDSFALNTARGALRQVRFGDPRSTLETALDDLSKDMKEPTRPSGVLDALHEGIAWFGTTRPGDSILLIADGIEKDNKVRFGVVADELATKRIRLFAVQIGPIFAGEYWTFLGNGPQGQLTSSTTLFSNEENVSALSWNSGGYMVVHLMSQPQRLYEPRKEDLENLQNKVNHIYGMVISNYEIVLRTDEIKKPIPWKLQLSETLQKRLPQAQFAYPRLLLPCTAP